jgi:hypothetical protein
MKIFSEDLIRDERKEDLGRYPKIRKSVLD